VEDRRGAFVLMPLPPVVVLPAGRAAREVRGAIVVCERVVSWSVGLACLEVVEAGYEGGGDVA
jgi:hypothetical protein